MEYQHFYTTKHCTTKLAQRICDLLNEKWGHQADVHWITFSRGGDNNKPISIDFYAILPVGMNSWT